MKKIIFTTFCIACFATSAYANTYVICGKTVNPETQEVTGYELELSSEGDDNYSGPVGKNWNMKLSENADWLKSSSKITAKNYQEDNDTTIEITIEEGKSVTGPVGTTYKLMGLYSDAPVLEKYTLGGFAGSVKIGTFQCAASND